MQSTIIAMLKECGPGFMSVDRTYALVDALGVSFFEKYLAGSSAYDRYLQPAWYGAQPDLRV